MSILDKLAPRKILQVKLSCLPSVETFVKQLTISEFNAMGDRAAAAVEAKDRDKLRAIECELLLCDQDGKPLLTSAEAAEFVQRAPQSDLERITTTSKAFNELSDAAVETAAKN